jgi:Zn-dependent protease
MKTLSIKFVITLLGILPAYSFAADSGAGLDMKAYSVFLSYGLLVIAALFFGYLIYCSTHPSVHIPRQIIMPANILQGSAGFEKIIPALNGVYYTVIIIMVLYAVIFVTQLL